MKATTKKKPAKKPAKKAPAKKPTKKPAKKAAVKAPVNKLFPGRPDYTGPTKGYFAMLHHDTLFEHSNRVMERVDYVKNIKNSNELPTRLHNMLFISNEDPIKGLSWEEGQAKVLAYVQEHIPDHAWSVAQGRMKFTRK